MAVIKQQKSTLKQNEIRYAESLQPPNHHYRPETANNMKPNTLQFYN